MKPGGGGKPPAGELADAISKSFGSVDEFSAAFKNAAARARRPTEGRAGAAAQSRGSAAAPRSQSLHSLCCSLPLWFERSIIAHYFEILASSSLPAATQVTQFGSGWAWLVLEGHTLKIVKTSNAVRAYQS